MPIRRKLAIVGAGIGRRHMEEGYLPYPDLFEVVAICDIDPQRLASFAADYGIPRATQSFAEVLAMPDVEIVDICTPPGLHGEQIMATLAAGKHAVCEKPLVGSLREVDAVIAAEARSPGRVMPIFQYRYGDGFQKARHLVESGIAGRPYLATVETAWQRLPEYYAVPWRGRWSTELGGTLITHAIHPHDMLCELMGPIRDVYARTATRVHPHIEVEDCAVASLTMESGALVSLAATVGCQEQITRLYLCFENLTFESSPGPYNPGEDPWRIVPRDAATAARVEEALQGWVPVPPRFTGQMRDFHAALESGGALPVTLADARRSLELLTAMYHSAETGEAVLLPIGPNHPRYAGWRPLEQATA